MESKGEGNLKHKRFGIQGKAGKEISRSIYWSIYH